MYILGSLHKCGLGHILKKKNNSKEIVQKQTLKHSSQVKFHKVEFQLRTKIFLICTPLHMCTALYGYGYGYVLIDKEKF